MGDVKSKRNVPITDPYKLEFGYIGPGHGSRGKQNWINADKMWKICTVFYVLSAHVRAT